MTESFDEKRRFPRIPAEHVVLVKKLGAEELEEFAKTMTVGLGGCMFVSDGSLGVGAGIELLLSVHGKVVQARGRVAYELPRDGNMVQVGVEFLDLRGDDVKVLEELLTNQEDTNGA